MYILFKKKGVIRVKDLAKKLKVKPASVVNFLKKLHSKELICYEKYEFIILTKRGLRLAEEIYKKHETIKEFLLEILRIPENIAEEDACYIEHGIHDITLDRMDKFVKFVRNHPDSSRFFRYLDSYYESGNIPVKNKV